MTKLLASTALIVSLAAPAFAQTATEPATTTEPMTTQAPATDAMPAPDATTAPATAAPATTDPATTPATTAADGTATAAAPVAATDFGYTAMADDMLAETFIGKRLYVSEADVDGSAAMNEVDENWDDVGEISDLVISKDGQVKAVLVDIGGFLGMGEKSVSVAMDQLMVIRDGDSENDYFIVFKADRAALENAPGFELAD
ncbi:PRC-barrel domain-containing protein [Paracoccus ravus]|uniref:PRC-barrel domain-containing protein n=1 Tax=Paracoccus ravus TaxID=2447760 RepID=UPI00106E608F|nr:PRC-barrel domain-containing protein [Paracoccus ravus]